MPAETVPEPAPPAQRVPHIVFAWEMGANFGHVSKITGVIRALGTRARCTIIARDVLAVEALAPDLDITVLPAPHYLAERPTPQEPAGQCYPGVLLTEGWADPANLTALVRGWIDLFDLLAPDIVVSQAAPTALLGTRIRQHKTVILGSGYDCPPRASPMPCYRPGNAKVERVAAAQEARAVEAANIVLKRLGSAPLAHFRDLLDVDLTLLICFPETDLFAPRDAVDPDAPPYLGQVITLDGGAPASWRGRAGPRILAYLRPGSMAFTATIGALERLGAEADIILAAPGIPGAERVRLAEAGVQVHDSAVRLGPLLPDCDLGLSHASTGVGTAFLLHGVPQIGLPTHQEQLLFAQAIARVGGALGIAGKFGPDDVLTTIRKALASTSLRDKARAAAQRIAARGPADPERASADALIAMAGPGA